MDPASIALVPNRVAGPLRASDLTSKMAPRLAPTLEAPRDFGAPTADGLLPLVSLTGPRGTGYGQPMTQTASRIDLLLSTLNATDVGTLDSIRAKLEQVRQELELMDRAELAASAAETIAALARGDIAEFKRGRAFLQSKIGHLRG